jgi:hypothetical protein
MTKGRDVSELLVQDIVSRYHVPNHPGNEAIMRLGIVTIPRPTDDGSVLDRLIEFARQV